MERGRHAGGEHVSYWIGEPEADAKYPALEGDARVDVAVLGGGIVGLTAAALLERGERASRWWR